MPRETEAACHAAGQALVAKLSELSFAQLSESCVGTSEEIGGYVSVIKGRSPKAYSTEQSIGPRTATVDECAAALAQLRAPLDPRSILESECLQGTETGAEGKHHPYFQPWITALKPQDGRIPQGSRRKPRDRVRLRKKPPA